MSEDSSRRDTPLRVAIVGAGPAGFYAAVELLRDPRFTVKIDMFDRLPTPFGLVRHGVAPDHEKIRSVTRFYAGGVEGRTVHYRMFGNVELGRDLDLRDLRQRYHAVILAIGAQSDRRLDIPGEELRGVHPASAFVAWYNGHPDFADARFDLSVDKVVVVGHGNVALDVCRMLCRTPEELGRTDTADHALPGLGSNCVREIVLLGRSGPAQAAYTPQEFKELTELSEADLVVSDEDREIHPITRKAWEAEELDPLRAKNLQIALDSARREARPGKKTIRLRFHCTPIEILGQQDRVVGLRVRRNRQVERDGAVVIEPTDQIEDIECGAIFRSIGYRIAPIEGVPFELDKNQIPNDKGQVLITSGGPPVPGMFVTGWAKRGPSGIIGTNKPDALETVTQLLDAWQAGALPEPAAVVSGGEIEALLDRNGVQYVTYSDWKLLDQLEVQSGQAEGRPRRKFTDVPTMLRAIGDARLSTIRDQQIVSTAGQGKG
ncbi:MAG: FAD-dependent oxidoreductase [Deltaproteobacteria bacterium]|nr:FAD-dependent oxidoreductase [Deltaproteobacteria bacterium]